MKIAIAPLIIAAVLSGCSGSSNAPLRALNPDNWFGNAAPSPSERQATAQEKAQAAFERATTQERPAPFPSGFVLVDRVVDIRIDPTPHGGILRVEGRLDGQAHQATRLVPLNSGGVDDAGRLAFALAALPGGADRSGYPARDAIFLGLSKLSSAREIVVNAAGGASTFSLR